MYLFQKLPCHRRQKPADLKLREVMVFVPQQVAMAGTADVGSQQPVLGYVDDIGLVQYSQAPRILVAAVGVAERRSWSAEAGVGVGEGGVRVPHVPSRCRVPY
jgi:hypothetical protein